MSYNFIFLGARLHDYVTTVYLLFVQCFVSIKYTVNTCLLSMVKVSPKLRHHKLRVENRCIPFPF